MSKQPNILFFMIEMDYIGQWVRETDPDDPIQRDRPVP